jgi:hypothetical protein
MFAYITYIPTSAREVSKFIINHKKMNDKCNIRMFFHFKYRRV